MSETVQQVLDTIQSFAGSYWASLGIAAVGGYLGLFTILRRIVFTGVALAQLATAGVACAIFVAERPSLPLRVAEFLHRQGPTIGSLSFSLLGLLGLESKFARRHLSSDALVGLAYAAASAIGILLVWRSTVGLVELQNILAGDVLLSGERQRLSLWIGLVAVVILHVWCRRPFLLVSYDPDFARAQGYHEQKYQRLLLGSLAVAVALSLRTAGLLLVFAVLVFPPLIGLSLGRTLRESGFLAVASGLAATLGGFSLSIVCDWPVAPSISLCLLVLLTLAVLVHQAPWLRWPMRVLLCLGAALSLVVACLVFSPTGVKEGFFASEEGHGHVHAELPARDPSALDSARESLSSLDVAESLAAAGIMGSEGDEGDLVPLLMAWGGADRESRSAYLQALRHLIAPQSVRQKILDLAGSSEPELAPLASTVLMELGHAQGVSFAIKILSKDPVSVLPRLEVVEALTAISGDDFGYDCFSSPSDNKEAIDRWGEWWQSASGQLEFKAGRGWELR